MSELRDKYIVTHKDGRPVDPGRRYFVLSPTTDAAARVALRAYVAAVAPGDPAFAAEIVEHWGLAIPECYNCGGTGIFKRSKVTADRLGPLEQTCRVCNGTGHRPERKEPIDAS